MLKIIFNVIASFCITSQSPKRLSSDFLIRYRDILMHTHIVVPKYFQFSYFSLFYFPFIGLALPSFAYADLICTILK